MSETIGINSPEKSSKEFGEVEKLWKEGEKSGNYALYLRALDDYLLRAFVLPLSKDSIKLGDIIDAMNNELRPLIFNTDDTYTTDISKEIVDTSGFSLENVKHMLGKDSEKNITAHNALLREVMLSMNKKETRQ